MAQIYGRPDTEKTLLRRCPNHIKKYSDIKAEISKIEIDLKFNERDFYKQLPKKIEEAKEKLKQLNTDRQNLEYEWNASIEHIVQDIDNRKKNMGKKIYLAIPLIVKYMQLHKCKRGKNSELSGCEDNTLKTETNINEMENRPGDILKRETYEKRNLKHGLDSITQTNDYAAAYGEITVLDYLKSLSDHFHVFCDVKITLPDFVRYRGKRNLGSAQIDFMVVGPTGVYAIEVKNWSNSTYKEHTDFTPHEQVDRAGLAMYIAMKNSFRIEHPNVRKFLVPVQDNMKYNPEYKYVWVVSPKRLRNKIEYGDICLMDKHIDKVVSSFKRWM